MFWELTPGFPIDTYHTAQLMALDYWKVQLDLPVETASAQNHIFHFEEQS